MQAPTETPPRVRRKRRVALEVELDAGNTSARGENAIDVPGRQYIMETPPRARRKLIKFYLSEVFHGNTSARAEKTPLQKINIKNL